MLDGFDLMIAATSDILFSCKDNITATRCAYHLGTRITETLSHISALKTDIGISHAFFLPNPTSTQVDPNRLGWQDTCVYHQHGGWFNYYRHPG